MVESHNLGDVKEFSDGDHRGFGRPEWEVVELLDEIDVQCPRIGWRRCAVSSSS